MNIQPKPVNRSNLVAKPALPPSTRAPKTEHPGRRSDVPIPRYSRPAESGAGATQPQGLSTQQLVQAVADRVSCDSPPLLIVLHGGQTGDTAAFTRSLARLGIAAQPVAEGGSGFCHGHGLLVALQTGRADLVTEFMEDLLDSGLTPQQTAEAVAAKISCGTPALFFAMRDGHAAGVAALMTGLSRLGLSIQQVEDIVAAKNFNGTPGLGIAMARGHTDVVTAFLDGLQGLGLTSRQLGAIAAARGAEGRNGLSRACKKGHAATAAAYLAGLHRLRQQNLITTTRIARIEAAAALPEPAPREEAQTALLAASRHVLRQAPLLQLQPPLQHPPKPVHKPRHLPQPQRQLKPVSYSSMTFLALCGVSLFTGVVQKLMAGAPLPETVVEGPSSVTLHLPPGFTHDIEPVVTFPDPGEAAGVIDEVMAGKGFDGHPSLFVSLVNGPPAAVTDFLERLKGLRLDPQRLVHAVMARDPSGTPAFHLALTAGRAGETAAYLAGLKGLQLDRQQIAEIVAARDSRGVPGLYFALSFGQAATVTAFMEGLAALGLNRQQVVDIVAAVAPVGDPGLYIALNQGHPAVVTAFMQGLKGLGLTAHQVAGIAASRDLAGVGGLYFPLQNGEPDVVRAFLGGLKGLELSPEQNAELAVPVSPEGLPGIFLALQDGHAATVAALLDSLDGLGLSPQQTADVAAARRAGRDTPYLSFYKWDADAAKAYSDGLTRLQEKNLIAAGQVEAIMTSMM